jgi:hypothetical protein
MKTTDAFTDRRSLLVFGAAAAGAALLAACGNAKDSTDTEPPTTTTPPSARDIALLRTASSIAELEVSVYQRAIDGGFLKTGGLADTAKVLLAQHKAHAALFEGETTKANGKAFTQPNPVLAQQYKARIDALADEGAFLRLAYDLSTQAAATLQAALGNVDDAALNVVVMSVAGVEARHTALLGPMINQPVAQAAFAATDKAVAPGTGV